MVNNDLKVRVSYMCGICKKMFDIKHFMEVPKLLINN